MTFLFVMETNMVELQYFLVEVCCHKMWRLHLKLIKFVHHL